MNLKKISKNLIFICDVDGVLTTGHFLYSSEGKIMKIFGPDDNDALAELSNYMEIRFVTSDKRGFEISKARVVKDMGYRLDLVSSKDRPSWIQNNSLNKNVIYMGDGILDHLVFDVVFYSIAPLNSCKSAKESANHVTASKGGDRAVAEACKHIISKFFPKSTSQ